MSYYSSHRFRSGLFSFLAGRLGSGILGLVNFLLLVRALSTSQYGSYVTAIALMELALGASLAGIDWVAIRALPEYRIKASARSFRLFVVQLLAWRSALLVPCAVGGLLLSEQIAATSGLKESASIVSAAALLLLVEGLARFTRDTLLDSLILQKASQTSLISKNVMMCAGLCLCVLGVIALDARKILLLEACAAMLGLAIALVALTRHLADKSTVPRYDVEWQPTSFVARWRAAQGNYGASLIAQLSSANTVQILVARMLDPVSAATFGFARQLTDQIRKYLPSEMFLGLIRPMIISRFSANRCMQTLCAQLTALLKLAMTPIVLAVIVFSAGGEPLLSLIGGERYAGALPFVLGFLAVMYCYQLRRNLELMLVTIEHSTALLLGSVAALAALPLGVLLLAMMESALGGVLGALLAEITFVSAIVWQLRRSRSGYEFPLRTAAFFFVFGLVIGGLAFVLAAAVGSVALRVFVAVLCVLLFVFAFWKSNLLTPLELSMLRTLNVREGSRP